MKDIRSNGHLSIESREGFVASLFEDRYDDMDYIIALEIFAEYNYMALKKAKATHNEKAV